VDQEAANYVAAQYNVKIVEPENIHRLDVDVYSPCALGSILNDQTIPELHCKIVCGSANNQLAEEQHGDMLAQQGILYAPDYIVSAGGVVYNLESLSPGGFNRQRALEKVAHIYRTMGNVIALAKEQNIPTYRAAHTLVERRIATERQIKSLAV
jgi:leucine dehydrogenase